MRALKLLCGAVLSIVALGLFERFVPRRVLRLYQAHIGGPIFMAGAGLAPGYAVLETTGRRTGRLHRVPVGGRLIGDTFWLLAATGRETQYVRNIERDPRVRIKIHGRWHDATATSCPDDDARPLLRRLNPLNGLFLWTTGFELLTVRVDLRRDAPTASPSGRSAQAHGTAPSLRR